MQVQLETIQHLIEETSVAQPLMETLYSIVVSEMSAAPTFARSGETAFVGEFLRLLSEVEEILHWELAADDELQRLQEIPQDELPPQFREMAAKYFEALAARKGQELRGDSDQ